MSQGGLAGSEMGTPSCHTPKRVLTSCRQGAYFRLGLANTMASAALGSRNWLSFPLGEATQLHGTLDCPQLGQGRGLGTIPPFWPGSPLCSTCSTRFGTAAIPRSSEAGQGSGRERSWAAGEMGELPRAVPEGVPRQLLLVAAVLQASCLAQIRSLGIASATESSCLGCCG